MIRFLNLKYQIFLLLLMIYGCRYSQHESSEKDQIECNYTYNEDNLKHGSFTCYYPSGNIYQNGVLRRDSIRVYELCTYFPSGELMEYKFYNPIGDLRFNRVYDEKGKILLDEGSFLSHDQLSKTSIKVGDSLVVGFYIASPPGLVYRIYGINSRERYPLLTRATKVDYVQEKVIYGTKPGNFILPYEVDIIDESGDVIKVIKSDVSFNVE